MWALHEFNMGRMIVFTGEFFNIVHRGHISLSREAKNLN